MQERMTRIAPEYPELWWELARLHLRQGDKPAARGALSAMVEITRDPERRRQITEALDELAASRN